jgi:hypothetical protein
MMPPRDSCHPMGFSRLCLQSLICTCIVLVYWSPGSSRSVDPHGGGLGTRYADTRFDGSAIVKL